MDTLQSRFREKASEMLHNTPTLTVAMGRGRTFVIETCYVVGNSDELHCIVKPTLAIVEAVRADARVAFTVNQGFPTQMLHGVGRAFYLGGLDLHPDLREQALAKTPEATAFLSTIRNLGVLQILPDHIAVTDDANLGMGPRPVYIPEASKALPDGRRRWMQALGMISWPLVLIAVAIAALLAGALTPEVEWWLLGPVVLVALLIHVGTNLLATYTGFRQSRARTTALGTNRLLHDGLLSMQQVWAAGLLCIAFGCLLGLLVVGFRGTPLLLIGVGGVVAGLVYAGWPLQLSSPWFEAAAVFLGSGPLLVLGTLYALTGSFFLVPVLVSVMLGCLVECILYASHLQAFSTAVGPKVRSLPQELGWERARLVFYGLVGLPYGLLGVLILGWALPGWAWMTFLSLVLVARHLVALGQATADQTQALAGFDHRMAQAFMAFGGLLIVSLLLG